MNANTGLGKGEDKELKAKPLRRRRSLQQMENSFWPYLIAGAAGLSILLLTRPSIKEPGVFFLLFGSLLIASVYLLFIKTYSFSVGRVPMLVADPQNGENYKMVKKQLSDRKKLNQLPSKLKTIHYVGIVLLWAMFTFTSVYLVFSQI